MFLPSQSSSFGWVPVEEWDREGLVPSYVMVRVLSRENSRQREATSLPQCQSTLNSVLSDSY